MNTFPRKMLRDALDSIGHETTIATEGSRGLIVGLPAHRLGRLAVELSRRAVIQAIENPNMDAEDALGLLDDLENMFAVVQFFTPDEAFFPGWTLTDKEAI